VAQLVAPLISIHVVGLPANHVIDWENAKVIDQESDKAGRLIREAIWIRKTENTNQDERSYQS